MKVKYYRLRECLSAGEAIDYIRLLTSVDLTEADFMLLLLEERLLDCYVLIPRHKPKDYPLATGRQRLGDFLADDFEWRHDQQSTELIFHPFLYHEDKTIPRRKTILLYGCTDFEDSPTHWNADTGWFYPEALIYFLRVDVEALAAKMNNQPSHQTLQEENQRLQQEIETLRAEVERLKADNDDLYGANKSLMLEQDEKAYISEVDAVPRLNHGLAFTYPTQLLKLVADVQQKFYAPDRFDINEPDSYPRKSKITEWLAKNPQLSKADIDRVERVATPFDRTPTSKKANH